MIIYSASVRKNNHHAFSPWAYFLKREEAESEIAEYRIKEEKTLNDR